MKKTQTLLISLLAAIALTLSIIWLQTPHKRYAVFAGYNKNGTIPPYVITYLKGLNEVADGVVYIADSTLNEGEAQKLNGLVIHTEHKRHNEYDWGSYKRGYNWLKDNGYLKNAKELIFANDSTYAPLGSFKPMFKEMDKRKNLDFWGDSQNTHFTTHLQSYFLVFRRPLFTSQAFHRFVNNVTHQPHDSMYITEYEVQFTPRFAGLGYTWQPYIPYHKLQYLNMSDKNSYPYTLITKYNHVFLKRRTFTEKLMILEDRNELLRYIAQTYPENYKDISQDIAPHFIPDDLKGIN
ncbi:MAG: rhamnan synthesis F family protein [Acetobacter sp.]|nr:rhamnan synthesis F family protein [Acetobacter sp.]